MSDRIELRIIGLEPKTLESIKSKFAALSVNFPIDSLGVGEETEWGEYNTSFFDDDSSWIARIGLLGDGETTKLFAKYDRIYDMWLYNNVAEEFLLSICLSEGSPNAILQVREEDYDYRTWVRVYSLNSRKTRSCNKFNEKIAKILSLPGEREVYRLQWKDRLFVQDKENHYSYTSISYRQEDGRWVYDLTVRDGKRKLELESIVGLHNLKRDSDRVRSWFEGESSSNHVREEAIYERKAAFCQVDTEKNHIEASLMLTHNIEGVSPIWIYATLPLLEEEVPLFSIRVERMEERVTPNLREDLRGWIEVLKERCLSKRQETREMMEVFPFREEKGWTMSERGSGLLWRRPLWREDTYMEVLIQETRDRESREEILKTEIEVYREYHSGEDEEKKRYPIMAQYFLNNPHEEGDEVNGLWVDRSKKSIITERIHEFMEDLAKHLDEERRGLQRILLQQVLLGEGNK